MFKRMRLGLAALLVVSASVVLLTHPVHATQQYQGVCDVSASPETIAADNNVSIQFTFTNDDPYDDVDWITITTPTTSFNILSNSADGWNSYTDDTGAEFTESTLASGDTLTLTLEVYTGDFQPGEMNWGFYAYTASTDSGPGTQVCSATPSVEMADYNPYVSDVTPTNVTTNSVEITWDTTLPSTSQIFYGPDDTYGSQTTLDNTLVSSHDQIISGLTPNTVYHYQVQSTTPENGEDTSDDNTFVTAEASVPAFSSTGQAAASSSSVANLSGPIGVHVTNKNDVTPPKITFTGLPAKLLYATAPTLSGQASDAVSIQRVEYSTDNGQDWLPVTNIAGLNTASATFSFTPVNLPDGTYKVLVRAINAGGLITSSAPISVIISSLPPNVGGNLFSIGPQVLSASNGGVITTLAGVNQSIVMSAVGGPNTVTLVAEPVGTRIQSQAYGLTFSPQTALWSGDVSITKPGTYNLISTAVDGAGISSTQSVGTFSVMSDPRTFNLSTKKSLKATITLFYKAPDSGSWVVWDGSGFSETNPQTTQANGSFRLFVPPGTYYLEATAPGFQPVISNIFTLKQSEPITTSLGLHPDIEIPFGFFHLGLPVLAARYVSLSPHTSTTAQGSLSSLVGKQLPNFNLETTAGGSVQPTQLLGKPTVIELGATWTPSAGSEMGTLSALQADSSENVLPIALQQGSAEVNAFTAISGQKLNWLVDPSSSLSAVFGAPSIPTYLFVDRNGIVRQVSSGSLTETQVQTQLSALNDD